MLFGAFGLFSALVVESLYFRAHAVYHDLLLVPESLALLEAAHQEVVVPFKVCQLLQANVRPLQIKLEVRTLFF